MENEENIASGDKIIEHFSNIKNICDSAIAFVSGKDKEDNDVFDLTEKIQEEIEEIRDLFVRVTEMVDIADRDVSSPSKAKFGDNVRVNFTLKLEDGSVYDSSVGKEPLQLTIGENSLLRGFENAIVGMSPGELKTVSLNYELAYGPRDETKVRTITRKEFPGDIQPEIGMQLRLQLTDGGMSYITVTKFDESKVTLDANHPLAGKNLTFDIELVDIVTAGPDAEDYYRLGSGMQDDNRIDEAMWHYAKAIQIDPDLTEAYFKLGVAYQLKNKIEDAISCYQKTIALDPKHTGALNNLGHLMQRTGRDEEAMSFYQRALESNPEHAGTYNNLGALFQYRGQMDEAVEHYRKAIDLDAGFALTYSNMGNALMLKGEPDAAMDACGKAVQLDPNLADAQYNISLLLLKKGNLKEGWDGYEWRLRTEDFTSQGHHFSQPLWDGQPLPEKTLLVTAEQGVGDEIMFASCLPDALPLAGSCVVECDKRLIPLFSRSFPEALFFDRAEPADSHPPEVSSASARIAMGSLPKLFRQDLSNFPSRRSYLVPDPEKIGVWKDRCLELGPGLKVGISWRGGQHTYIKQVRSIPLAKWSQIFVLKGAHFISLQYGDFAAEIEEARKGGALIHAWEDADTLKDLDAFAAQISALDLVISVDNATVHMAGALGKPVWALLPFVSDWRWMLNREDSPWYPTMRLFRQPSPGDWDTVLGRAGDALGFLIDALDRK